jgi:ABC-2 type transport system permease protein
MNWNSLLVLYKKELADHLRSKRFVIVLLLITITGLASIYAAATGIREAVSQEGNTFVFLRLFTASGNSIPSFLSFVALLGPLVGLALGFDSINGEFNKGTMSRLLSQPIHRDNVVNGKFLAGVSVITIMVLSLGIAIGAIGIIMIGIPPTMEEILRLLTFFLVTILYISLWLALSHLFSLLFKQSATSALACIAAWLFFSIFVGLLAGVVSNAIYPIDNASPLDVQLKNSNLELMLNRISPSTLFNEATICLLNPGVRTINTITLDRLIGAIPGVLPFSQSILLIWPHLVSLVALNMICFAVSYVYFMRQEVRA